MSKLVGALRKLHLLPDMTRFQSDFSTRLVLQKVVYLVQEAGLPLGYGFGWYVRGPYSPSLARDGYELSTLKSIKEPAVEVDAKTAKRIRALFKNISLKSASAPDQLVLLASLHFIAKHAYPRVKNLKEAKETLKRSKPRYNDAQIDRALRTLVDAGLVEPEAAESP